MATVYVETTIPSYYFETRRTIQAMAWREVTRRWWDSQRFRYRLVTSSFVLNELSRAPAAKSSVGAALLADLPVLSEPPLLAPTIRSYIRHRLVPADALGDAAHLAMASLHGVDFLLTWNCKHLANANKARHLRVINERLGLPVPILTTPLELVPEQ